MYHLYSYDVFFLLDISVIKLSYLCSAQRTWRGFFGDGWNKPLPNLKHIARTLGSSTCIRIFLNPQIFLCGFENFPSTPIGIHSQFVSYYI